MIKSITPISLDINSEALTSRVLGYLHRLKEAPGSYKMSFSSYSSLISTCFASFILYGLNKLDDAEGKFERNDIISIIEKHRYADGTFWDLSYPNQGTATHDREYLRLQFTTLSISALKTCGYTNHIKVKYLSELFNTNNLKKWIFSLYWRNAWLQGNRVMFLGLILLHNFEYFGDNKAKDLFYFLLECLDQLQDPLTGFWGTKNGASLHNAMAGAYHLFLLYDYANRPFNYIEKIIDNTLKLQNKVDYLFSPYPGGGACDDMDGIYTLISCSHKNSYRNADVDNALMLALGSLIGIQNDDGGFPYTVRSKMNVELVRFLAATILKRMTEQERKRRIKSFSIILRKKCLPFQFSGNPKSVVLPHESDLFSTWFRMCSIALIESHFKKNGENERSSWWNFLPFAGLGWYKKN